MILLLAAHALMATLAPLAARRSPRAALAVGGVAPAVALVWTASHAPAVVGGDTINEVVRWLPDLGLEVTLRLDAFSLLMALLISGVGVLVFWYAASYMGGDAGIGRFAGTLCAFAGSMLGMVLVDNLLALYVFWELTSLTSYLLIGFEDRKGSARSAALQALLVTSAGGFAMLAGFVVLGQAAGTYELSAIVADPPSGTAVATGVALVLVGAFTKSAQVPFHSWLPGAMAAPTPVSAYLHSATLVKAGVYLLARLAPAFAAGVVFWRPVVVGIGVATMLVGGWRALQQHDLKLLLAYGTVSQLGLMTALVGAGRPEATFAGVAVIAAHGLFKAALFLVVGIVDHQAHSRDLRRLSGVGRRMPTVAAVAVVATASMVGLPPLLGFLAKEEAFESLLHAGTGAGPFLALAGVVAGSVLTVAYGARFLWGVLATKPPAALHGPLPDEADAPSLRFVGPAAVLVLLTVVLGLLPGLTTELVRPAAAAVEETAADKLALWHGVGAPLVLSALTLAAGALLFAGRGAVERAMARVPLTAGGAPVYKCSLAALNRAADRLTGIVQNGSLPVYLGVILLTVLVLPGVALVAGTRIPDGLVAFDVVLQLPVVAVVIAAAVGAAVARRRFPAVLFLGGVGYGVAALFAIQGAPDLALTQFLVETLVLVIFVLVLRHLPDRFRGAHPGLGRRTRLAIAGATGAFVAAFAVVAAGARAGDTVSRAHVDRALPEGGGRNVVNVILVDFRGFDTLGEITVLAVAALGIASLVLAGRQRGQEEG